MHKERSMSYSSNHAWNKQVDSDRQGADDASYGSHQKLRQREEMDDTTGREDNFLPEALASSYEVKAVEGVLPRSLQWQWRKRQHWSLTLNLQAERNNWNYPAEVDCIFKQPIDLVARHIQLYRDLQANWQARLYEQHLKWQRATDVLFFDSSDISSKGSDFHRFQVNFL